MYTSPLLAWCFLLFSSLSLSAQYTTVQTASGKLLKRYEKAVEYGRSGAYEEALRELEKVLGQDPNFVDAYITQAAIYDEQQEYEKAEAGFERVATLAPDYEPMVWYRLALTELQQEKFEEAETHLNQYLKSGPDNERMQARAEKYLADLRIAAELMRHPVPFDPVSLGANINTAASETLPSFTADGGSLIFTRLVNGQEDFFISEKVDGVWQPGRPMEAINTPFNEGAQTISADGTLLVYTSCDRRDGIGRCDLYFSELRNGRWSRPANMGRPINSAAWESQPCLSASGRTLYFASNRKGTLGGSDLWVSHRRADGNWSEPRNLGPVINTADDDAAPFIHPDDRTLYFMSKGHPGMGGFDLFFATRKADGGWEEVTNLGYPINTTGNEGALVVSLDGQTAYFASDRLEELRESGGGAIDLYRFELYPEARPDPVTYVKAVVLDAETGTPLTAEVEFVELDAATVYNSAATGPEGDFMVCLPQGRDYALNVSKPGYLFHSENFALAGATTPKAPFLLEIALSRIPEIAAGPEIEGLKPVVLRNVFFETGSAALKPASRGELDRLVRLLEENDQLRIQINGHTDDVGSAADNLQLSEGRAQAVYKYLVDAGIDAGRLRYRGFGETQPIAGNDTPEGRQQNRRTEFVVIP